MEIGYIYIYIELRYDLKKDIKLKREYKVKKITIYFIISYKLG